MTNIDKIIIASSAINLMATQLNAVAQLKMATGAGNPVGDSLELDDVVSKLKDTMESLGNYIDSNDMVDDEASSFIDSAFDIVYDRNKQEE